MLIESLSHSTTDPLNTFKYNGIHFEREGGLNSYIAPFRTLDPTIARWSSVDPMNQFLNPYVSMGGDPVSFSDPMGLWSDSHPKRGGFADNPQPRVTSSLDGAMNNYWRMVRMNPLENGGHGVYGTPFLAASMVETSSYGQIAVMPPGLIQILNFIGVAIEEHRIISKSPYEVGYYETHYSPNRQAWGYWKPEYAHTPGVNEGGVARWKVSGEPGIDTRFQDFQEFLDLLGVADPTGCADLLNACLYALNGDLVGAGISMAGIVPYAGDILKVSRKSVKPINLLTKTRTPEKGLEIGERFLRPGYREIDPGVFRSADNLRQFRMTNADILGTHGKIGPHFNFEIMNADGFYIKNYHMPIR